MTKPTRMQPLPPPLGIDTDAVKEFWGKIVRPGHVHEIRIPKVRDNGPNNLRKVVSGYFDHPDPLIAALATFNGYDAEGIYVTLNPVNPDLIARAENRLNRTGSIVATADNDIEERRNLFIDIDPVRPSGISASNEERDQSLALRDTVAAFLREEAGWPDPIAVMQTGNGGGLIYRIALPNIPESSQLVNRVLKALKMLYETASVTIDTTTSNAARIVKLVGTVAAKGDDTEARPWRRATATYGASALPVPREQLEFVSEFVVEEQKSAAHRQTSNGVPMRALADEMPTILDKAGIGYSVRYDNGYAAATYKLDRCLTSDDHTDGACILAFPSGAVSYLCHHNRCQGKNWFDVRELLGLEPAGPRVSATVGSGVRVSGDVKSKADLTDTEIADSYTSPPDIAFFGRFEKYRQIMAPTTSSPDAFHLGVILTLVGAMAGRRVALSYSGGHIFPGLYTVLVGPSGTSKKDTAIQRAIAMASNPQSYRVVTPAFRIEKSIDSAQGMIKTLKEHPNTLFYISEFTKLLKHASRQSTSTILDDLLEAWDTPETLQNNTKNNPVVAIRPFASMATGIQPGRLSQYITPEDIQSGFVNRCLFFFAQAKPLIPLPPLPDWKAAWNLYLDLFDAINQYPEGTVLKFDPGAVDRWTEWYLRITNRESSEDEADVRARHDALAQKLSLIYALSEGAPAVMDRHVEPAIALVDWMWSILRESMKGWAVGLESQIELKITQLLERRGAMSRRDLHMRCSSRKWSARDFAGVFRAMSENGTIAFNEENLVALT